TIGDPYRDLLDRADLCCTGDHHLQHAVLVLGLDVVGIHPLGDRQGSLESAVVALQADVLVVFLSGLLAALTADGQHAIVERDLDVLGGIDAGEFRPHHHVVVPGEDIDRGRPRARLLRRGGKQIPEAAKGSAGENVAHELIGFSLELGEAGPRRDPSGQNCHRHSPLCCVRYFLDANEYSYLDSGLQESCYQANISAMETSPLEAARALVAVLDEMAGSKDYSDRAALDRMQRLHAELRPAWHQF